MDAAPGQNESREPMVRRVHARDRRLRRQSDFDRVFTQGRHNSGRLLAVRTVPNEAGLTRLGYSVSKRVGKAVVRNKVRRRLREIARALPLAEGYDIVITARPATAQAEFAALRAELTLLLRRARLLEDGA